MYILIKIWLGARNEVENNSYDLSQAASTGGVTQAPSSMQNAQSTSVSITVLMMMSYVDYTYALCTGQSQIWGSERLNYSCTPSRAGTEE